MGKNYLIESMLNLNGKIDEARNPENDEVNATIRKWANNDRLSKKDKEILDKNGLFTKSTYKYWPSDGRTKAMTSKATRKQLTKDDINNTHPDYDLTGKLNKKELDRGDVEDDLYTTRTRSGVARNYEPDRPFGYDYDYDRILRDTSRKDANYKVSVNQLRSLQPYTDEKQEIRSARKDRDYAAQKLKSAEDRLSGIKNSVKAKHDAKKKNESLSLNEGAQHTKFMMKILQAVPEHLDGRYKNINITIDSQASGLVVSDGTHTENYNITLKMAPVYSISNGMAGTIYKFTPVSVTTVSDANQVIADLIRIIKQDFDL